MVKIRVENRSDNIWAEYDVDLAETVQKLKADIENTEGTAIGRQCLKYGGQELRDEQNLQSYSIQEGSIVEYFPSQNVDKLAEIARIEGSQSGRPVCLGTSRFLTRKSQRRTIRKAEALTARKVGGRDRVRKAGRGGGGGGGGGKEARGKAIYEWDGNMKHPNIRIRVLNGLVVMQKMDRT
ncbi:hypothetical protein FB451DRAFT_438855 [Mycena latifolia]|nr:hypothetical protein FB451DRAFT_438855 [Mycena latifolia]